MSDNWEKRIVDPKERRVFEALSDPNWDFRTIEGLATTTGLSQGEVKAIIDKYPEHIRKSAVPSRNRRELYTLRSRPVSTRERLALARAIISKSVA